MKRVLKVTVFASIAFFLPSITEASPSAKNVRWGLARSQDGKIVYKEKHEVELKNGTVVKSQTTYADSSGSIATLTSDYGRSVRMPEYEFVDLRTKYREGLRWKEDGYVVYHQTFGKAESSKKQTSGDLVFSCQGWHYFLKNNLELLEKGNIALKLVLPSELDAYSFRIRKLKSDSNFVEAKLELDSWLLRTFAPSLRLLYDRSSKHLVEYEGISNIADSRGERQHVKIAYSDDEPNLDPRQP